MSTIYGIVKQNQGFINVYSEPKQGTTFKIYLPQHMGKTIEEHRRKSVEKPLSRGETVLFVDDDQSILMLGERMLTDFGYNVLTAGSPKDAIKFASEYNNKIHLLVTDVVMPEMNGRELSEKLQGLYPKLQTLFMSGYTANVIAHRGVLDEGVHFISKPLSREEFAVKIRQVLDETTNEKGTP